MSRARSCLSTISLRAASEVTFAAAVSLPARGEKKFASFIIPEAITGRTEAASIRRTFAKLHLMTVLDTMIRETDANRNRDTTRVRARNRGETEHETTNGPARICFAFRAHSRRWCSGAIQRHRSGGDFSSVNSSSDNSSRAGASGCIRGETRSGERSGDSPFDGHHRDDEAGRKSSGVHHRSRSRSGRPSHSGGSPAKIHGHILGKIHRQPAAKRRDGRGGANLREKFLDGRHSRIDSILRIASGQAGGEDAAGDQRGIAEGGIGDGSEFRARGAPQHV